tara:strand:- start:93 stop:506 length:414 start_codon:yes stop_codon:yes gene_type:complete
MDLNVEKYLKKLLKLDWQNYKLYLVGGALEGWPTKDIDICIIGPLNEKKIFKLIEKARALGPFDLYYVTSKKNIKGNNNKKTKVRFAKSYDRCCARAAQRPGKWINGLFWQELVFPTEKNKHREYTKKPKLIYDGSL